MNNYTFKQFYIPDYMMGGLTRYVENGIQPGPFLTAVICNDLRSAVANADDENMANIPAYVAWLHNRSPMGCWGSKKNVDAWVESKMNAREQ